MITSMDAPAGVTRGNAEPAHTPRQLDCFWEDQSYHALFRKSSRLMAIGGVDIHPKMPYTLASPRQLIFPQGKRQRIPLLGGYRCTFLESNLADESTSLEIGSRYYKDQLAAEAFKLQVRKDAKRIVDEREKESVSTGDAPEPKLIYAPIEAASPELMPGLIPESGTAAIVGETDTGKSLVSLEIASSLLTGMPLWGAITPNRTIKKVVYILGEHTCETVQGLYHRTKLPHAGDFTLIGPEHLHPYKALVIGGIAQSIAIERLLRWTEGAELIVFDPLAGFVQGQAAENDNSSMRTLIDSMSLIATKNRAACLILSHMGKPLLSPEGAEVRRMSYASRGATAIEDSLTHIFYLRKANLVKQQGNIEKFDLVVRKFKGSNSNEVFKLERDPETKRNKLLQIKNQFSGTLSKEEKRALMDKIQRVRERNPGFNEGTVIKLVADSEGYAQTSVERWLTEA